MKPLWSGPQFQMTFIQLSLDLGRFNTPLLPTYSKCIGKFLCLPKISCLTEVNDHATKRSILSQCAKLFDPLGLLGPVIVIGKILIQQLWKYQLAWNDPVSFEIQNAWVTYTKQLLLLNDIKFKRVILENSKEVQLDGFCDTSDRAYGARLYFTSTVKEGKNYYSRGISLTQSIFRYDRDSRNSKG